MLNFHEFRYFCNFVAISSPNISIVFYSKLMKILQNGVQTVDNELKKFHVDWMKVSNSAEL